MSNFDMTLNRPLDAEEISLLRRVFGRIQSQGLLPRTLDGRNEFAAYLLHMYLRGLVIEDALFGLGVAAARARYQGTIAAEDKSASSPHFHLRRIAIIEDDYQLASELKQLFESAGAFVLGPVASEDDALDLLNRNVPDLAIVDLNLGDGPSFRITEYLQHQAVPFCVVSGYRRADVADVPSALREVPWFEKPVRQPMLLQLASELTSL